jgi:hypothetical protein
MSLSDKKASAYIHLSTWYRVLILYKDPLYFGQDHATRSVHNGRISDAKETCQAVLDEMDIGSSEHSNLCTTLAMALERTQQMLFDRFYDLINDWHPVILYDKATFIITDMTGSCPKHHASICLSLRRTCLKQHEGKECKHPSSTCGEERHVRCNHDDFLSWSGVLRVLWSYLEDYMDYGAFTFLTGRHARLGEQSSVLRASKHELEEREVFRLILRHVYKPQEPWWDPESDFAHACDLYTFDKEKKKWIFHDKMRVKYNPISIS